jgi:UDP-galactopyranose mutase
MKDAVVIGGGFTGCSYTHFLLKKGWRVTIIEQGSEIGGGVKTYFHGGHPFTYGPRHFIAPESSMPAFEFLNNIVPMRHINKINFSYQEPDDVFTTYPLHHDDIELLSDSAQIIEELKHLDALGETKSTNFEEFWIGRVGKTLYERYNKHYNKKAWFLDDNRQMDFGFEATVKRKPLETGPRYEFHTGWINAYPIAHDGYNKFFDWSTEGAEILLNTKVEHIDFDTKKITTRCGKSLFPDLVISTTSPDLLFDCDAGELAYVGREVYKIVLPTEQALPDDVYFVYYPGMKEQQTRVSEFKKFTLHKSPNTLLTLEVPSMKNKLYPTLLSAQVELAEQYINRLPDWCLSVGRMGKYRYVDIDDILLDALDFDKNVL